MTEIKVWILAGVSGCGKSTFTNVLKSELNGKLNVCSTDSYIDDYCKENNVDYQEAYKQIQEKNLFRNATAKYYSDIEDSIKSETDFVVDRTNLTSGARKHLIENLRNTAKVLGHELSIRIVFFDIPIEELLRRNGLRSELIGKFIPPEVLLTQMKTLENVKHDEGHNILKKMDEYEDPMIVTRTCKEWLIE